LLYLSSADSAIILHCSMVQCNRLQFLCVCIWQFKAAIANVWVLQNEKVSEVSLFSSRVVPEFLSRRDGADDKAEAEDVEPLLYIGLFVT